MSLLELSTPLLKRRTRLRVGTPTNSVSFIHLVGTRPDLPKWVAEQSRQRVCAIVTMLRKARNNPIGSRAPRGCCSLAYDLFRCFLGLPTIDVELSFSMLFRNPSASLAFDAFSFSAGSSLFGCLFCMTSRSRASEAHSTAIQGPKSARLSFVCPDPIRLPVAVPSPSLAVYC
jgi:hypothetical protein